jgi:hypothetical protein
MRGVHPTANESRGLGRSVADGSSVAWNDAFVRNAVRRETGGALREVASQKR